MAEKLAERLLAAKRSIDEKKELRARLEGQRQEIQRQLVEQFEVRSVEEAQAKLAELEKDMHKDEVKLAAFIAEIEDSLKELET